MLRVIIPNKENIPVVIESDGSISEVVLNLLMTINCIYKKLQDDDPKGAWAFQTALVISLSNPEFWKDDYRPYL